MQLLSPLDKPMSEVFMTRCALHMFLNRESFVLHVDWTKCSSSSYACKHVWGLGDSCSPFLIQMARTPDASLVFTISPVWQKGPARKKCCLLLYWQHCYLLCDAERQFKQSQIAQVGPCSKDSAAKLLELQSGCWIKVVHQCPRTSHDHTSIRWPPLGDSDWS